MPVRIENEPDAHGALVDGGRRSRGRLGTPPGAPLVLSQREVCRVLRRSPNTIRAMVEACELPSIVLGRRRVIPAHAVEALLRGATGPDAPGMDGPGEQVARATAEATARALSAALRDVSARFDKAASDLDRLCIEGAEDQPRGPRHHPRDTLGAGTAAAPFGALAQRRGARGRLSDVGGAR
jgi:excisionase family DNA binding protein